MFISPVAIVDAAPQIVKQTAKKATKQAVKQTAKQTDTFISAYTPIGVTEGKDNIIITKAASDLSFARMLDVPKAELDKITSIFW